MRDFCTCGVGESNSASSIPFRVLVSKHDFHRQSQSPVKKKGDAGLTTLFTPFPPLPFLRPLATRPCSTLRFFCFSPAFFHQHVHRSRSPTLRERGQPLTWAEGGWPAPGAPSGCRQGAREAPAQRCRRCPRLRVGALAESRHMRAARRETQAD